MLEKPRTRAEQQRLTALGLQLRALVNRWDPFGLMQTDEPAPPDEYDALVDGLLQRLHAGALAGELGSWLSGELASRGLGDPEHMDPQAFARIAHGWYQAAVKEG